MRKLLALGVAKEIAGGALDEILSDADQEADAARAAAGFLRRFTGLRGSDNPVKIRARLTAFLLRRGYPWAIVGPIVKKAVAGGDPDHEEAGEGRR